MHSDDIDDYLRHAHLSADLNSFEGTDNGAGL